MAATAQGKEQAVQQSEDQTIRLNASAVQIKGPNAKLEGGDRKYIVWWNSSDSSIQWPVEIKESGGLVMHLRSVTLTRIIKK